MIRTILITGCSSGIGLDAARTMKSRGWRVIATARRDADIAYLKEQIGVEALYLELADPGSIATCAVAALEISSGKIDAIFNNGAHGQPGAIEDLSPKALRHQFEVNVIGTHDITRRIIPAMRKYGHGRIVQCSSVLGLVSVPYRGAYCASKFALEALSSSLRLELRGTGIKVSMIEPGPIRTNFVDIALQHLLDNVDIANSPHREMYMARINGMRSGGVTRFKLEPEAVTKKLIHAVESRWPRRQYYVTVPTYLAAIGRRALPPALAEYLATKI